MSLKKPIVGMLDQVIEVLQKDHQEPSHLPLRDLLVAENQDVKKLHSLPPEDEDSSSILNNEALIRAMTICRRRDRRVPAVGPVMLMDKNGQYICKGEGRNISPGGIGAQVSKCQQRIEVGQTVILEIFGNKKLKPFRAEAEVLNFSVHRGRRGSRHTRWSIGMRWISMSQYVANMIAEYALVAGGTMGGFDYTEKV